MSVFELKSTTQSKDSFMYCTNTWWHNHYTYPKALHLYASMQTIRFTSTNNVLVAAFSVSTFTKLRSWSVMWAVFSDDPLCHPLPHCPQGDTSHTEPEYHVHVWVTMTCVWEMCRPHAIVQMLLPTTSYSQFNFKSCHIMLKSSSPLCATQNRSSLRVITCAL